MIYQKARNRVILYIRFNHSNYLLKKRFQDMKCFKNHLLRIAVCILFLSSCNKEDTSRINDGESDMAFISMGAVLGGFNRGNINKHAIPDCSDATPTFARVVLTHDLGEIDAIVPVLSDNNDFFTDYDENLAIPIPSGENSTSVSLTEFLVYAGNPEDNSALEPIWAAPKTGSAYAVFVENPLEMNFELGAGTKKYVQVEVLCFDDREVNQFGYQFFDFYPVSLIKFCLFGNYCDPITGKHYVAGYDVTVWQGADNKGDLIYDNLTSTVNLNQDSGAYYAKPLCLWLPDRPGVDNYYFEIRINNTAEYSTANDGEIILSGAITDAEIKMFYNEDNTLEYYHFNYGCRAENPPPFEVP